MGLRIKKFVYDGFSLKNLIFRFGSQKKQYVGGGGGAYTKRTWTVCKFKKGLGKKKGSGVFEGD